jgi:hypothetical protein
MPTITCLKPVPRFGCLLSPLPSAAIICNISCSDRRLNHRGAIVLRGPLFRAHIMGKFQANDFLVKGLEEIEPAFASFDGSMFAGLLPTTSSSETPADDDESAAEFFGCSDQPKTWILSRFRSMEGLDVVRCMEPSSRIHL